MLSHEAEVLIGQRYLDKGFLDDAFLLFQRNAEKVTPQDWARLRDALMKRGRAEEAVQVCRLGQVDLPRQELLERGDRCLDHRDVSMAIYFYELAKADQEKWSQVVDALVKIPGWMRRAWSIADKHLVGREKEALMSERTDKPPRHLKAVK